MKNFKKSLVSLTVVAGLALGSTVAQAACNATTCTGTIDRVFFTDEGDLKIRLTGIDMRTSAGADNCTTTANYGRIPSNHDKLKEFYALALTVMALEKTFAMRFVDSSTDCEVQYVYTDN